MTIKLSPMGKPTVKRQDTIRPEIVWRPEDRQATNKAWSQRQQSFSWGCAFLFWVSYFFFLGSSIFILSKARPKYSLDVYGQKAVSEYYEGDVQMCCDEIEAAGEDIAEWGLCHKLDVSKTGRRLAAGSSKFEGDEGIFDAFLQAPRIIFGLIMCVAMVAATWIMLLRNFADSMVFGTEIAKVVLLLLFSFCTGGAVSFVSILMALGLAVLAYKKRNELAQAARVISHSALAFRTNPRMVGGLLAVKLIFVFQAFFFIIMITASFEIVEVIKRAAPVYQSRCPVGKVDNFTLSDSFCFLDTVTMQCEGNNCISLDPQPESFESDCVYSYPSYVRRINYFQIFAWFWSVLVFDKIRLAVVSMVVGSWHFHSIDAEKPTVATALKTSFTKSIGTLAFAGAITGFLERFRKNRNPAAFACCWCWWLGPQILCFLPFQALWCLFGTCLTEAMQLFTKFSVIVHVFTGLPLDQAASQCKKIMNRHFVGGFITEYSTKSMLMAGSYIFSTAIAFLTWSWVDATFECTTLTDTTAGQSGFLIFLFWVILFLVIFSYPMIGLILIVMINSLLEKSEESKHMAGEETTQHLWISPLAAAFVGCTAKLIFDFMSGIILDTVDTMFLCFAIDQDNGINRGQNEFATIVKAMPGYVIASPVDIIDPEQPMVPAVIERELEPEAEVKIHCIGASLKENGFVVDRNGNVLSASSLAHVDTNAEAKKLAKF